MLCCPQGNAMFMTKELALIFVAFKLLMGSVIGLVVSTLAYRSRLSVRLAVMGALLGGTAFLLASGIAGWAGSHAAFNNGHRVDVAPWERICGYGIVSRIMNF